MALMIVMNKINASWCTSAALNGLAIHSFSCHQGKNRVSKLVVAQCTQKASPCPGSLRGDQHVQGIATKAL